MAITHSGTEISFDGFETGDNLRAYIAANGLGVVTGREAFLDASVGPTSEMAQFEDSNCTWVFRGSHHWSFQRECAAFEITDGVIIVAAIDTIPV